MKKSNRSQVNPRSVVVGTFALFVSVLPTCAAPTTTNYQLTVQTSRANALYQQGEVVRFDVTLLQNGEPLLSAEIRWSTSKDGFPPERVGRLTLTNGSGVVPSHLDKPRQRGCGQRRTR